MKEKEDAVLFAVLVVVLLFILLVVLPFAWNKGIQNTQRVYVMSLEECKAGVSCQSCVEQGRNNKCIDGICDASGACIIPFQGTNNPPQETGLRALVLS
jgi:hypothetical protein